MSLAARIDAARVNYESVGAMSKVRSLLSRRLAGGAEGLRGVFWDASHGRFKAEIGNRTIGTRVRLGRFSSAQEAAEAYDIAAIEIYGADAVLNFPLSDYRLAVAAESATHCAHGHLWADGNRYISPSGLVNCRACNRLAVERYKESHSLPAQPVEEK